MLSPLRTSPASRLAGLFLALLALVTAFFVATAGLAGLSTLPGLWLRGAFSWAAWFVPAWLCAAALVCFLPGFRPGAIFALIGSLAPFIVVAAFARIQGDPAFLAAFPLLEALGLPVLGVVAFLVALLLSLVIARVALGFGKGEGESHGFEDGEVASGEGGRRASLPLRLVGPGVASASMTAYPGTGAAGLAGKGDAPESSDPASEGPVSAEEPGFDFKVPVLPPLPALKSFGAEGQSQARQAAAGPAVPPEVLPQESPAGAGPEADVGLPAAGGGERVAAAAQVGEAVPEESFRSGAGTPLRAEAADEPIPLMFGDRSRGKGPGGARVIEFTSVPPGQGGQLPGKAGEEAESGESELALAEAARAEAAKAEAARRILARKAKKTYAVPVDGLLNTYPDGQYWIIDDKTRHSAEVLQETLAEFNIKAEVTGIRKGPVITMFEILPAPGVRLSKIANLADNIALRLAASSVRIVAPIPGKHAVGIEVPNDRRAIVSLREIVENEAFRTAKMEVPVILGKDIAGEAQFIDLVQTPHLLIAGATGSGKSVCVNSLILSILFRRAPEEVKLILIDPKIVELKLYNDVPHLLTPVITEPKRAFQALQYCICEMERRYSMLDRLGVRDIKSYNKKIKEKALVQERLPYIVVIIDEFADLMATTGKELESTLARLAAMSRAVGIHLVLATQRPSIDVITGLIKANIPSRIAFMVASKFDSRIIIDMVGAEKLLGRGDMLFASAWDPFPIRMQGAFVSEEEVEKAVEFVKTLGEPEYIDEEIFIDDEEEDEGPTLFDDGDGDPLFEQALEIVLQQGKASASYIQRKLKIGYNRAARLVELMEERGIVGPAQGSKPRDIVRNPEVLGMGGGKMNTPPANRGNLAARQEGRQPSLLAGVETVPGESIATKGAAASGGGLDEVD